MWAFWRLLGPLLQQPWTATVAVVISLLSLGTGAAGWLLHWPSYLSFLIWGVIWALVAFGAWTINR